VFEAYDAAFPRLPGAAARVGFYQLYPLLVHVNSFGGSYVHQVEERLAKLPG
jgi:fructosamine-3-kinase